MRVHIIKLRVITEKKCDAKKLFSNVTYKTFKIQNLREKLQIM